MATPANTIGAGEPDLDELARPVAGGIPKGETRLFKRKKKKKKGPEWHMTGPKHDNA